MTVRSTPFVTGFHVRYHYRPYTGWGDSLTRDPHLKGLRGTEVTLVAHTNRTVKEGRLEKGMPSFSESPTVMQRLDELYAYLKGRSNGDITRAKVEEMK